MSKPTLYSYYRSSAAYRVRIALALKSVDFRHEYVNIAPGADAQHGSAYLDLNPEGRVPFFIDENVSISQSPAILEYLEEKYPRPALLPSDAVGRAKVRQICALIHCDIHPLNNLSVLKYLKEELGAEQSVVDDWYVHWIKRGFDALERMLAACHSGGVFCYGDSVSLADVYLVPQVYNARRFNIPLNPYPEICRIESACNSLESFRIAAPENQQDAR